MSDSSLVMKGRLSEFKLADVLRVVSMSRQFTAIELRRLDGARQGVIWIKSGHVVGAQRGAVQGLRAFSELVRSMAETFVVWRLEDPQSFNAPLGRIPELLDHALNGHPRPEGSQAGPRPLPLPPPPRPSRTEEVAAVDVEDADEEDVRWNRTTTPLVNESPAPRLALVATGSRARSAAGAVRSGVVLAVSSPKGGVGKTTIALNLSVSLAQRGIKTVLVDADINGDQLSLLDARDRVSLGVHDILDRTDASKVPALPALIDDALRDTAAANLRLLPSSGGDIDLARLERGDRSAAWRTVLDVLRARADIVLIDCPAGMLGVTRDVLCAASHVLGVFQSEMVARRSFAMFMRGFEAVPAEIRPQLLGVVVNMFQRQSGPSLEAFYGICDEADSYRLFETTIPRSEAFAQASLAGQPLRATDGSASPSPVAWLFDMLADEICARVELRPAARTTPRPFLL